MQRHLERSVVLDGESDFKSLYSWSVSEVGEGEARAAIRQIPWPWSLYFTLSDVQLISSVSRDRYSAGDDEIPLIVEKTFIRAKLRPGHPADLSRPAEYSMFGTARKIEDISLSIHPKTAADSDDCRVFGGVSYTHDLDFHQETAPDYLGFTLNLRDEFFAQMAARIERGAIGGGTLRVDGVAGFYSDWSPSISTSRIKVLTSDLQDHPVQTPEGCEILPPRLGQVGDFDLTLWSDGLTQSSVTVGVSGELEDVGEPGDRQASPRPRSVDPNVLALLKSVRLVAWIIAALLVIIAIK